MKQMCKNAIESNDVCQMCCAYCKDSCTCDNYAQCEDAKKDCENIIVSYEDIFEGLKMTTDITINHKPQDDYQDESEQYIQKSPKCINARCGASCDNYTSQIYGEKPDKCSSYRYAPAMYELKDTFESMGIYVRAKINRLCNDGKFEEAKELQEALSVINKHDYM